MKKVLAVLSFMTLLLFSCTNDENSNSNVAPTNNESSILLKKSITEYNGNITTKIYNYDGNKILSISNNDNSYLTKFTYTGNLITKVEFFENNTLVETNIYEYDTNERLTLLKNYQGTTTDTLWFYE